MLSRETLLTIAPPFAWALVAVAAGALVALTVNLQMGFFLLLFAIMGWWSWQNPTAAFFLLLVLSPVLPLFKATQLVSTVTLIKDVVILMLWFRLFGWPLATQTLPYRRSVLWAPMVALAVWTAVGTLQADEMVLGILRARDIILYLLLYFVALYVPKPAHFWRELVGWVGAATVSVLVVGAYQWFFAPDSAVLRFDPARAIWIPRISSTFVHPSVFGHTLVLTASAALALFLTVRRRAIRIGAAAAFLALSLCVYLTYSRGVWLGFAAALAAIAGMWLYRFSRVQRTAKAALLPLVGLLIVLVIAVPLLWRFTTVGVFLTSAFDTTYKSNSERLEFMVRLVGPITNMQALFGQGLGDVLAQNFREVSVTTYDVASGAAQSVQQAKNRTLVDNQYLKTFIESGVIGLLIYAWLFVRLLKASWALYQVSGQPAAPQTRLAVLGLASMGFAVAFAVQAVFVDIWDIYPTNAFFWIVAGLLSGESVWVAVRTKS